MNCDTKMNIQAYFPKPSYPGTSHQSFVLHPLHCIQTHKVSQRIPSVSKGVHTGGTLTPAKTSTLLRLNLGTKHLCHLLKIRQKNVKVLKMIRELWFSLKYETITK